MGVSQYKMGRCRNNNKYAKINSLKIISTIIFKYIFHVYLFQKDIYSLEVAMQVGPFRPGPHKTHILYAS